MISFVPRVYSGVYVGVRNGNGKRGGLSYPSDFMDDHGLIRALVRRHFSPLLRLASILHHEFSP